MPRALGGYGSGVQMTRLIAIALVAALFAGCSQGDLKELGRDTREAVQDAGDALQDLADQARGPLRQAVDDAMQAAADAREASREFERNPSKETRQALEDAKNGLDAAGKELEGLVDKAPAGVKDALQRALDALTELRKRIQRELDSG